MLEITNIAAGTKLIRGDDGTYSPVADDDPRAKEAKYMMTYPMTVIQQGLRGSRAVFINGSFISVIASDF